MKPVKRIVVRYTNSLNITVGIVVLINIILVVWAVK